MKQDLIKIIISQCIEAVHHPDRFDNVGVYMVLTLNFSVTICYFLSFFKGLAAKQSA